MQAHSGTSARNALVIGIDAYRNGVPPLSSAVRDARAIAEVLAREHGYRVTLLVDEEASLAGIRAALAALVAAPGSRDRMIFYFAGHGIAEDAEGEDDGPRGYFIPQDAESERVATFLAMDEVRDALARPHIHHLLLLLDCCFAGSFQWSSTRDLRVRKPKLFRERYERYLREPAWQAIASSACDERALDVVAGKVLGERAAGHSPFAAACIEGLRGAANVAVGGRSGDGVIIASELYLFVEEAFFRYEQITGKRQQTPSLWSFGGPRRAVGQFVFELPGADPSRLPSALELNEGNNPYRGLAPYGEASAGLFFGREAAARALLEAVQRQVITVVVGASGTGKSSLVAAGLLPRLRGSAGPPFYKILAPLRPESAPMAALERLVEQLQAPPTTALADAIVALHEREPAAHLVLVVDQLEELVTQTSDATVREGFLRALTDAAARGAGWLHIVMTLRLDFEAHFAGLLAAGADHSPRFLIPHMSREELRQVIEGPASERVLFFEPPALVDTLIDEVIDAPGALPLLSFTLSEMFRVYVQRARDDRTLRKEDYESLGGVSGALARRADEVYERLDADARTTMRHLLLRMVVPGESARRPVFESELRFADPAADARMKRVCAQLVDARLAASGKDALGRGFVEPAHDKLVTGWPLLQTFVDADRDRMVLMHALGQAAAQWAASGRASGLLWDDDPRRPQALALRQAEPARFNAIEQEFVERSQIRRKRFWITVITAVSVAIVGLSVVAAIALIQRDRAIAAQAAADEQREAAVAAQGEADAQRRVAEARARAAREATRLAVAGRALSQGRVGDAQAALRETESLAPGRDAGEWLTSAVAALEPSATERAVMRAHGDGIVAAVFSADGAKIATASHDRTARVWDATTGRSLAVLEGHEGPVLTARFSPDGARVVTASYDRTARVWDAATGAQLVRLAGHRDRLVVAAFSPDGTRVATAARDNSARLWDASSGEQVRELAGHSAAVLEVEFSRDGRQVVTASLDGTARVWDVASGRAVAVFKKPRDAVRSARFSPDGTKVVTGSGDRSAMIWTVETGAAIALEGHGDFVDAVEFSPDGTRVVTTSADRTAKVWDAASGALEATLGGHSESLTAATFSPDGARVLTASGTTVRVWRADGGAQLAAFVGSPQTIYSAQFSPDGARVLIAGEDRTARLWHLEPGLLLASVGDPGAKDVVAQISPDGARVAIASGEGRLALWDAANGRTPTTLAGHTFRVDALAFSRDGSRLLSFSRIDGARTWDASSGRPLAAMASDGSSVISAQLSPDGVKVLTVGSGGEVGTWDAVTGNSLAAFATGGFVLKATFSADGTRVATESEDYAVTVWDTAGARALYTLKDGVKLTAIVFDRSGDRVATTAKAIVQDPLVGVPAIELTTRLRDARTGAEIRVVPTTMPISTMAFGPDGTRLVTGLASSAAQIWDVASGEELGVLEGHDGMITSVAFSADGGRIVTTSDDGTARVWDAASRRQMAKLQGHDSPPIRAEFSADGRRLLTYADRGPARVWWGFAPGDDEGALQLLWRAAPSCPDAEERAQLLGLDAALAAAEARACEAMVQCVRRGPAGGADFPACLAEYRLARPEL